MSRVSFRGWMIQLFLKIFTRVKLANFFCKIFYSSRWPHIHWPITKSLLEVRAIVSRSNLGVAIIQLSIIKLSIIIELWMMRYDMMTYFLLKLILKVKLKMEQNALFLVSNGLMKKFCKILSVVPGFWLFYGQMAIFVGNC